jgi:hypothetical protein
MKNLLLLSLLVGCTQKYMEYDLVRKADFQRSNYNRPIMVSEILAAGEDQLSECFNQWLFFSNAEKEKDDQFPMLVRLLCPRNDYLLNTKVTETWWTTILFTRSCLSIKTDCGRPKSL